MLWMYYYVFVSFAAPIGFGFWLANRAELNFNGILKGVVLGLIFMLGILYITELQIDLYIWKVMKSEMSAANALGADWVIQALGRALRTLTIVYAFYLMVYGLRIFARGRAAKAG